MWRGVEKYNFSGGDKVNFKAPIKLWFSFNRIGQTFLSKLLFSLINNIHVAGRDCRRYLNSVESIQADSHFLEEWYGNSKLSFRRNISDLQIKYIFAVGVNSS